MEPDARIQCKAFVAFQVVDSSTGRAVSSGKVNLLSGGKPLPLLRKNGGMCVVLESAELPPTVTAEVLGFEPMDIPLTATTRWNRPTILHLVPQDSRYQRYYTLKGQLDGLTELSCLDSSGNYMGFKALDKKREKLTVFNRYNKAIDRTHYGIIASDGQSFSPFTAYPTRSAEELQIEDLDPQVSPQVNDTIAPVIYGMVSPDGTYLLRVSQDTTSAPYLVRFVINGIPQFKILDFRSQENTTLGE